MFHINFQVTELARAANPGIVPRKTILPASRALHIPFLKRKVTKNSETFLKIVPASFGD